MRAAAPRVLPPLRSGAGGAPGLGAMLPVAGAQRGSGSPGVDARKHKKRGKKKKKKNKAPLRVGTLELGGGAPQQSTQQFFI